MPPSDRTDEHLNSELPTDYMNMTQEELREELLGAVEESGLMETQQHAAQKKRVVLISLDVFCILFVYGSVFSSLAKVHWKNSFK